VPGFLPLVPPDAPAFLRRFVLSQVMGPPLGRLPSGTRRPVRPEGVAAPAPEARTPRPDETP
jgi:hypothetical protein